MGTASRCYAWRRLANAKDANTTAATTTITYAIGQPGKFASVSPSATAGPTTTKSASVSPSATAGPTTTKSASVSPSTLSLAARP